MAQVEMAMTHAVYETEPESKGAHAIGNVAISLFAEKSFDSISINEIAMVAGVSKQSIVGASLYEKVVR